MIKPDICIYHGNCADGFTAAWAVYQRFGSDVEYIAGVYGEAPPDVAGKNVVIVDFSYKRPVLMDMIKTAHSILVLDHHKTAEADLVEGDGVFISMSEWTQVVDWTRYLENLAQDEMENVGARVYTVFDMTRSGAGIAWDFFHSSDPRPPLVDYVEDRDLWRFYLPRSRDLAAYIFAHEYTFENWHDLHVRFNVRESLLGCMDAGAAIEKKHHKDVAELVAKSRRKMIIGGVEVSVANLPYTMSSDAGHLMSSEYFDDGIMGCGRVPFGACYFDTPRGRVFSLRSQDDGYDVSEIAKKYGGGGHKNAAGFTMPIGWEGDGS